MAKTKIMKPYDYMQAHIKGAVKRNINNTTAYNKTSVSAYSMHVFHNETASSLIPYSPFF